MKKHILTFTLGLLMSICICACGSTETVENEPATTEEFESESEENTGIAEETVVETTEVSVSMEETEEESTEAIMTLEEWVKSPEKEEAVNMTNEQLAASGLEADFDAIGSMLILTYKFIDLTDFSGATDEEIYNNFDTNVSPVLLESAKTFISFFDEQYNIVVDAVRLEIYNADDTELFSKDYDLE